MRIAVIDLGTNTFNLTISETRNGSINRIIEQKQPVKIGEGSLKNNFLQPIPIQRGFETLTNYKALCNEYGTNKIIGFATSAIRSTKNGKEFIDEINKKLQLNIEIIDGTKEAHFIYSGVKNCVSWKETALIVDIGGGSNEVIIGSQSSAFFSHSFNLGVARLKQNFELSDPLTQSQKEMLFQHFKSSTQNLQSAILKFKPTILIGSSGTFDTLHKILKSQSEYLKKNDFHVLINRILELNLNAKKEIESMPEFRAEFIHLGVLFIKFLLTLFSPKEIIYSEYSLKEGVIYDLLKP